MSLHARLAWCASCPGLVAAEEPLDAITYELLIASLRDGSRSDQLDSLAKTFKRTVSDVVDRKVAEYKRGLKLCAVRSSPPRCLECGSNDVKLVEPAHEWPEQLTHPDCGGTLFRTTGPFVSEAGVAIFDEEGRRLEYSDWVSIAALYDYP